MFGSPNCLLNNDPPKYKDHPNLCVLSKNVDPLLFYPLRFRSKEYLALHLPDRCKGDIAGQDKSGIYSDPCGIWDEIDLAFDLAHLAQLEINPIW